MDGDRQRIDRWLWHARVVKTRELAKALVEGGHVRVDRERETKAGAAVKAGQTLTITLPSRVRVLRIVGFVERRGSAEVAARLYEDLSPPAPPRANRRWRRWRSPGASRVRGGRPNGIAARSIGSAATGRTRAREGRSAIRADRGAVLIDSMAEAAKWPQGRAVRTASATSRLALPRGVG